MSLKQNQHSATPGQQDLTHQNLLDGHPNKLHKHILAYEVETAAISEDELKAVYADGGIVLYIQSSVKRKERIGFLKFHTTEIKKHYIFNISGDLTLCAPMTHPVMKDLIPVYRDVREYVTDAVDYIGIPREGFRTSFMIPSIP